jgi:GntR family transcriptional regulator
VAALPLRFDIQPSDSTPIYRQIVEQVQRRVRSGQWGAGEELPSVRAVALEHAINPMTVSKAYSLLEAKGLLERRRGMGMVVAAQAADPKARLWLQLEPALTSLVQQVTELGLAADEAVARFAAALRRRAEEAAPPAASLEPQVVPVPPAGADADADAKVHPATRPST